MLKFSFRKNSIYIVQLIIYYNVRKIIKNIINKYFSINCSLLFTYLMYFGEFFVGLCVYLYQKTFLRKSKDNTFLKEVRTIKMFKKKKCIR